MRMIARLSKIHSPKLTAQAGLTALDRRNIEKPTFAAPGGTPSGTVRLGLSGDRQATQNSLNRRGDEGGEQRTLEKLGFGENKITFDNDDWMIGLNQPRPLIFIGWEVLPGKQQFTTQNQAKLLILPKIGTPRLDRPREAVRPPGPFVPDRSQATRLDRPSDLV
jgi:hypothetical protein